MQNTPYGGVTVNQHVLNVITPSGFDYTNTTASIGENIGKIYCISKYPTDGVDYGWLADLCNLEGTITHIEFKFTNPKVLTDSFNKQISEYRVQEKMAKEESERQIYSKKIEDLEKITNKIAVQNEPVVYMNIMLFIQDHTLEKLNEGRIKRVNAIVASNGCNIRLLKYRQCQAVQAIAPYGIPSEVTNRRGNRDVPISTFTGGFPMSDSGINDPGGYYLARTKNGRLVFLNMWIRNKDRTNSNWIITGIPGVGKSTALKNIDLYEYAHGTKILKMDPEQEYHDIAKHPDVNGDIIDCGGGKFGRINPLQFREMPIVREEDLEEGEDIEDFFQFKEKEGFEDSAMAHQIQFLRSFFKLYFGKEAFTADIKARLEECLEITYNKKGIYWDTDSSKLKNEDYPIMADLFETVNEELEKARTANVSEYMLSSFEKLRDLIRSAAIGADKFLWNGYTTLKADSDYIILDTFALHEKDDNVKNAQNFNISGWAWSIMSQDRTEKVLFGIDEGYLCVDPDYPDLMKFLRNISKRDRKYEAGLMFITHSIVDILDPAVKRFGQAIIDNACYKLIMGCDGKNLEETAKLFNLSSKEITFLSAKNRGDGILFAGNIRQSVSIDVPERFLTMMGTAGGR